MRHLIIARVDDNRLQRANVLVVGAHHGSSGTQVVENQWFDSVVRLLLWYWPIVRHACDYTAAILYGTVILARAQGPFGTLTARERRRDNQIGDKYFYN
jgi:hypothetical protein